MGLNPLPPLPPRMTPAEREEFLFRQSITPKRTTERLWFAVLPVLLVAALVALVVYALAS